MSGIKYVQLATVNGYDFDFESEDGIHFRIFSKYGETHLAENGQTILAYGVDGARIIAERYTKIFEKYKLGSAKDLTYVSN